MGQGSGLAVSCGVGCKYVSDPALLWLWCRLAAIAPIQPLAWELPYTSGVALESKAKKKKKTDKKQKTKPRKQKRHRAFLKTYISTV